MYLVLLQLLHGFHGLKPSETVIEFIIKYHTHFSGGVFWVNGTCPEFVSGAELEISKVMSYIQYCYSFNFADSAVIVSQAQRRWDTNVESHDKFYIFVTSRNC